MQRSPQNILRAFLFIFCYLRLFVYPLTGALSAGLTAAPPKISQKPKL